MATMYTNNLTRLSPGVYRNSAGKTVYNATGKPPLGNTQASGNTTQQNNNQTASNTGFNVNRAQNRVDYLQKVRPGDAQIGSLQRSINLYNSTDAINPTRVQQRIAFLQKVRPNDPELGILQKKLSDYNSNQSQPAQSNPAAATDQPSSAAPATTEPQPASTGSSQSPMTQALMQALGSGLNTMKAYEPQNFEGSPLYQFQKQKGLQDMERLMASRGLTNSGAELQANSDFLANINATEAEKQRQYADQQAQRVQNALQFIANYDQAERNNLADQQQSEATRGDRRQELALNFLNNILGLQAQNDIARISQGGLNSQTDLTQALMQAITNNIGANVRRAGGGGVPAPPPPSTTAGNNALAQILSSYGNSAGNNDVFNSIIKTLFS